ncbi:Gfo/Idh/MocA family oxidoreductase [Brachybacterium halotolerans subsp. kimchii]|uniref:Gfo/Idh/MocA family protein n=1 Tax=Brachybacterium halotolerans TaxID=2795215 RepID=UPI001E3C0E32|nr:Gfo/Idh/MocA family oxidoreductase [Brachybacterium halotolerans]UEJ84428.1 Gfo/Idh/MocA family oxidoreductase [Brachybacterium halotolerans subsp. kimchii]
MSAGQAGAARPIALIGTRGFGAVHLRQMAPLRESGRIRLVGVVDVAEPEPGIGAPWFPSLAALLEGADEAPEVLIIATPITTHADLAREGLAAGCHLYLEKPPVPSLADHEDLLRAASEAGRAVQVGFQARGGGGAARMRKLLASGALGEVRSVDAFGAWMRDRAYYARSPWAGRRRMDGRRVADGVATNPLAHAVDLALQIAGISRRGDIARITTELRRAHDIEADDTTYLRVDPAGPGPFVQAALVTTAPSQSDPWIEIRGEKGRARLEYTTDHLELVDASEVRTQESLGRRDLLVDLLDHLDHPDRLYRPDRRDHLDDGEDSSAPLLSSLERTEAFTTVLEATQSGPDPRPIGPEHITWDGEGQAAHPVVRDIEDWMGRALHAGAPFSRIGAPFADPDAVHETTASALAPQYRRASDPTGGESR